MIVANDLTFHYAVVTCLSESRTPPGFVVIYADFSHVSTIVNSLHMLHKISVHDHSKRSISVLCIHQHQKHEMLGTNFLPAKGFLSKYFPTS